MCSPVSPSVKVGRSASDASPPSSPSLASLASVGVSVSKTTRHPGSRISFPEVLNFTLPAVPSTLVVLTRQSG